MGILTKSRMYLWLKKKSSDLRPQVKRRLCWALSLSSCKVSSAFWMWPSDSSSRFLTPQDGGSRLRARRGRHSSVLPPTGEKSWQEGEEQSFQNTKAYDTFRSYCKDPNTSIPVGKIIHVSLRLELPSLRGWDFCHWRYFPTKRTTDMSTGCWQNGNYIKIKCNITIYTIDSASFIAACCLFASGFISYEALGLLPTKKFVKLYFFLFTFHPIRIRMNMHRLIEGTKTLYILFHKHCIS